MTCISIDPAYDGSCYYGNYYVPSSGLTVNCWGGGCKYIGYFYIWDEYGLKDIDYKLNTCDDCSNDCILTFELRCDLYWSGSSISYSSSDSFIGNYDGSSDPCLLHNCGCDILGDQGAINTITDIQDKTCPNYVAKKTKKGIDSWETAMIVGIAIGIILCLFAVGACVQRKRKKVVVPGAQGELLINEGGDDILSDNDNPVVEEPINNNDLSMGAAEETNI